jgi:hypothetical protein
MSDEPISEFERRFAELDEILEEIEAAEVPAPLLPGLPRPPGLLARLFTANPTRH